MFKNLTPLADFSFARSEVICSIMFNKFVQAARYFLIVFSMMSINEMHKMLSELLPLSDSVAWKIANPWSINNDQYAVMH